MPTILERSTQPSSRRFRNGIASLVCYGLLIGTGLLILETYLRALVWAAVLAIAFWPLFERIRALAPARLRRSAIPALFALLTLLIVLLPVLAFGWEAAQQAHALLNYGNAAEGAGLPVPSVVQRLPPKLEAPIAEWWRTHLSQSQYVRSSIGRINAILISDGEFALRRVVLFIFAPLALFFLLRDGVGLRDRCSQLLYWLLGSRGDRVARQISLSIHGTVNGLILVGLGEGALLGTLYALNDVPHAVLFAAVSALLAMVPYAAGIAIAAAALVIAAAGKTVPAVLILAIGFSVNFTADHLIRPTLIGGKTKIPFLWVLLGILGGLEQFGLLGLFIGPAVLSALVMLWRDFFEESAVPTTTGVSS